jgi:hypothetical protein
MSVITAATTATQLLANAMTALNAARERAKVSQDTDLKVHINTLYDELLSLKEILMRLTDENKELRHKIEGQARVGAKSSRPELRQVGGANFYFDGEKGPYCQPCYDVKEKLVALTPAQDWNGGVRRQCLVCNKSFYEKPMEHYGGPVVIS